MTVAGAGMHIQGGGGYSPGVCQQCSFPTQYHNGKYSFEPDVHSAGQSGGCYFSNASFGDTGESYRGCDLVWRWNWWKNWRTRWCK